MRMIAVVPLVLALLAGVACQPAEQATAPMKKDTSAADVEAILAVRDSYIAAENAGDAAAVAALFADNATLMPPTEAAVSGRQAIEAYLQNQYAAMTFELSVTSRETKAAGDIGYDTGTHRLKLTPKPSAATKAKKAKKAAQSPIEFSGKHVVIAGRQADGAWKITNMIYNADTPVGPMPGAGQ